MEKALTFRLAGLACLGLALVLSACGEPGGQPVAPVTALPTVTPVPASLGLIPPASAASGTQPALTPQPVSPQPTTLSTSSPAPTATAAGQPPLKPGTLIQVNGVIQQILFTSKKEPVIVVEGRQYLVNVELYQKLGKRLAVGVPLTGTGRVEGNGQIVILSFTQINNQVIQLTGPDKKGKEGGEGENEDEGGDD